MNFDDWNVLIVNKDLTPEYYGIISNKPGLHISSGIYHPLFARKGEKVKFGSRFQNFFGDWISTNYAENAYPDDLDGNYILNYKKEFYPETNSQIIEAVWYELNTRYGKFYFYEKSENGLGYVYRIWPKIKKKIYFVDSITSEPKEVASVDELKKLMRFN